MGTQAWTKTSSTNFTKLCDQFNIKNVIDLNLFDNNDLLGFDQPPMTE